MLYPPFPSLHMVSLLLPRCLEVRKFCGLMGVPVYRAFLFSSVHRSYAAYDWGQALGVLAHRHASGGARGARVPSRSKRPRLELPTRGV